MTTWAEALKEIAHGAIVSPDQPPETVARHVLLALRLVREQNCEYLLHISTQEKRAERAEGQALKMLEALCDIRDQAECYLQPLRAVGVSRTRWETVRDRAVAAIAAVKGESNEDELV